MASAGVASVPRRALMLLYFGHSHPVYARAAPELTRNPGRFLPQPPRREELRTELTKVRAPLEGKDLARWRQHLGSPPAPEARTLRRE